MKKSFALLFFTFIFGFLALITKTVYAQYNIADLNQDGVVDLVDYTILTNNFFKTDPSPARADINSDGVVDLTDYSMLINNFLKTGEPTASPTGSMSHGDEKDSMAMMAWGPNGGNVPIPEYDRCDDGTDVVEAHNQYYVIAYDGMKYPTWHPPVVDNPITGVGKCYFGHEHGTNPQGYQYWNEIVQHFGQDQNGDGSITAMVIDSNGKITENDRAGIPFGIANEKMDQYYNQEGRDSYFVRHEDHVGHKIEFVNGEADMIGNSTHVMGNNQFGGVHVPYGSSANYQQTGVMCTHLHKFHQGTHSADALRNNMHEVIFHSTCTSTRSEYPTNSLLLTGMMTFGNPAEYARFCYSDRFTKVCTDGQNADGSCRVTDPLISKLPDAVYSHTLGRNMVDRQCLENWSTYNPGNNHFAPYEIWEGDLRITTADGDMLAEHGRQWDVLDPIRFIDPESPRGFSYNAENCARGGAFDGIQYIGGCASRDRNEEWDSPRSGFRGLKRTTYFGRNRLSNPGGPEVWWTDPLGGNAVPTSFNSGLKQRFSSVEADICRLGECSTLNDRAIQRTFDDGGGTVHAPN